jgi:peroxiredoxin
MEQEQTSLHSETVAMRQAMRAEHGDGLDAWDDGAKKLRDLPVQAPGLGATAPQFDLPDADGTRIRLSDLLEAGSVVLVFYRGAWCPYCNIQLRAFQARADEITAAGATLVAVSPQTPDKSTEFAQQEDFAFTVVSDVGNETASRYGLAYQLDDDSVALFKAGGLDLAAYNGDGGWHLPAAATFVIGRDGRILFESVSTDYRWRVGPEEVLEALAAADRR